MNWKSCWKPPRGKRQVLAKVWNHMSRQATLFGLEIGMLLTTKEVTLAPSPITKT